MKAPDILKKSAQHMLDRATTYDKPEGERSMAKTVQAFNAITGRDITTAEGWLMLAVLKQVRAFQNPGKPHVDSLEDGPAYLALMAEEMLSGDPVNEPDAAPPAEPAQPVKKGHPVKLAVGQVWKDRLGREVTILSSDDHHTDPFEGSNNSSYMRNGTSYRNDTPLDVDLVELIQDENVWIPWEATMDSVCPVSGNTPVCIRLCNKTEDVRYAGAAYWDDTPGSPYRIEAYKVFQ